MAYYLTLNDGERIEIAETSTPFEIVVNGDLNAISKVLTEITTDNLKNADLNGTTLTNKIYTGFTGKRIDDLYNVTFLLRDKTDIEIINDRLDEHDAELIEIYENM